MNISKFKILDEYNTPKEAVEILLPYLKPNSKIWCPFDKYDSQFVKVLFKAGHKVIFSHIDQGWDFINLKFKIGSMYENGIFNILDLESIDYIISNPPFSQKDRILEKLYGLGVPFALLLPTYAIGGQKRYELFSNNNLELLIPKQRIKYIHDNLNANSHPSFHSSFFCWKILPKQLIFTRLEKDND